MLLNGNISPFLGADKRVWLLTPCCPQYFAEGNREIPFALSNVLRGETGLLFRVLGKVLIFSQISDSLPLNKKGSKTGK